MKDNLNKEPFGRYAPDNSTMLFRLITKLGISRGPICRWLKKEWIRGGYQIVDTEIRGIKYRLHIAINPTDMKLLTSSKIYDNVEIQSLLIPVIQGANKEPIFVDVGANTGYYSLSLANLGYSKVIAIEPNPPTLDILRYNVKINDFDSKITVVPLCIGDGQKISFYCSGGLGNASIFRESHNSKPIMVDSLPLLDILQNNGVTHVNAMKIDIEGFEDRALFPFFKTAPEPLWPRVLVIEVCNQNLWENDIVTIIKKYGYALLKKTRANLILIKK